VRLVALTLLCFASALSAQVRPVPGGGDGRLQTVMYNPEQVVQLSVAEGFQLMVVFGSGEHIETIAVGDSNAWQVTANKRGDYFFVKSVGAVRMSNLTVVTDARIYSFELVSGYGGSDQPYLVRFVYPQALAAVATAAPARPGARYRVAGARQIRPSSIVADGDRASIAWPADLALPAVFRVDDDGQETLVNGEMRDGQFVVAGVPDKFVFRLGQLTATATRIVDRKGRR
jgi:type IV secretion system protein VirB9